MNLYEIRDDLNKVILDKQSQFELTFEESTHRYTMRDLKGNLRNDWHSVSKVLKKFYEEFDSETISYNKAKGDPVEQQRLLSEWKAAGDYSTNMGSRVHYMLEKKSHEIFRINKEVRKPEFDCDFTQILKGDSMINAGTKFLNLMNERNGVLLDTEIVLGHPDIGYTGQPDKVWIIENKKKTEFGLLITDYKTNKPKNFMPTKFTKKMKEPFGDIDDTALGHYYLQLPFYGKLLLKMLEGTKYENIRLYGCIVTLLKEDSEFEEFRVPQKVIDTVLDMDMKKYLI
jgi:hypothetical protein